MLGNWDRRLRQWPIAARLIALVAVIAVPLFAGVVVQIRGQVAAAERVLFERMNGRADVLARLADELAAEAEEALALATSLAAPELADPGLAERRLRSILAANSPELVNIALFGPDGRLIATAAGNTEVSIADREHFQRAMAGSALAVSEPFQARTVGRWAVAFARGLKDEAGAPRAVAVVLLDLARLTEGLRVEGLPEGSLAFLVSRSGATISRGPTGPGAAARAFGEAGAAKRILSEASGRGIFDPGDGIERVSTWQRLARVPWTLYVGVPLAEAQAEPLRRGYRDLAILLVVTGLGVVAAAWLGRRISGPVGALSRAAGEVAAGSYGTRVAVTDRGELGRLERDFNAMVERIGEASAGQAASEARWRSLLNLSSDWYWEQDAELRLTRIAGSETDTNWARFATQVGKGRWDSPYGGITEDERAAFDAVQARREPFRNFEFMRLDEKGEMRWVSISGEPVFGPGGEFLGYRGTGHDIDDRKRAEQALRESEERFRALLEASTEIVWTTNAAGEYDQPQPAIERYTGFAFEDYRGEGWIRMIHPEDRDAVLGTDRRALAAGTMYKAAFRLWHAASAGWRHVEMTAVPVRRADGSIREWVGMTVDVHERRVAEQAYLVSEERLAAATHAARIGIFEFNTATQAAYFSPDWKAQAGYADAELPNRFEEFERRIHPEELAFVLGRMRAYFANPRGDYVCEFRFRHRDGSWRWIRAQARMFADEAGKAVRFVGAHVDITESRNREIELAERRRAHETLLANLSGMAYRCRNDGRWTITLVSPGCRDLTGYPPEDLLGNRRLGFADLVKPGDAGPAWFAAVARSAPQLRSRSEFRIVTASGEEKWVWDQAEGVYDDEGRLVAVDGLLTNITPRVRAEQAVRESEARYRALLETTTDAVVMVDDAGRITYANPATAPVFGWSPEELVGQPLERLHPERLRERRRRAFARVAAGEAPRLTGRTLEMLGRHRSGREIPLEVVFRPLELGGRRYFVGFLRDISLGKQAERELREINASLERHVEERTAELRSAVRELEAFSYTVAHDLRAPLRAIDGFSQVLEEDQGKALGEQARRYLRRIRANTAVMARMIDELLELSRIGRAPLERRSVDLDALARAVAEESLGASPRATVEFRDLPVVEADATLMRIVLANLVGNALKFSARQKKPRVTLSGRRTESEDIVSVADNGAGFDPQFAGKLFGVFQRLHASDEFDGTGIGLATVARIVQRHGGRVWAESRPGEGATFHFALPRAPAGAGARAEAAA